MKESILRTIVPVIVALLVRWGVRDWLGVDDATLTGVVTVGVTGLYYVALRVLEKHFPAAGWALGYPAAPTYPGPASDLDGLED